VRDELEEAVKDGDVLILEEPQYMLDYYRRVSSGSLNPEAAFEELKGHLERSASEEKIKSDLEVIYNKKIRIEAADEFTSQIKRLRVKAEENHNRAMTLFMDSGNLEEAIKHINEDIKLTAKSHILRDTILVEYLKSFRERYPNASIVVLRGAAHHMAFDILDRENYTVEESRFHRAMRFDYKHQLLRRQIAGRPIRSREIKKWALAKVIFERFLEELYNKDFKFEEPQVLKTICGRMSYAEIEAFGRYISQRDRNVPWEIYALRWLKTSGKIKPKEYKYFSIEGEALKNPEKVGTLSIGEKIEHPFFPGVSLYRIKNPSFDKYDFALGPLDWGKFEMFITEDAKVIYVTPVTEKITPETSKEYFAFSLNRRAEQPLIYYYDKHNSGKGRQVALDVTMPAGLVSHKKKLNMARIIGMLTEAIGFRSEVLKHPDLDYFWMDGKDKKTFAYDILAAHREPHLVQSVGVRHPAPDLYITDKSNKLSVLAEFGKHSPNQLGNKFSMTYYLLVDDEVTKGRRDRSLEVKAEEFTLSISLSDKYTKNYETFARSAEKVVNRFLERLRTKKVPIPWVIKVEETHKNWQMLFNVNPRSKKITDVSPPEELVGVSGKALDEVLFESEEVIINRTKARDISGIAPSKLLRYGYVKVTAPDGRQAMAPVEGMQQKPLPKHWIQDLPILGEAVSPSVVKAEDREETTPQDRSSQKPDAEEPPRPNRSSDDPGTMEEEGDKSVLEVKYREEIKRQTERVVSILVNNVLPNLDRGSGDIILALEDEIGSPEVQELIRENIMKQLRRLDRSRGDIKLPYLYIKHGSAEKLTKELYSMKTRGKIKEENIVLVAKESSFKQAHFDWLKDKAIITCVDDSDFPSKAYLPYLEIVLFTLAKFISLNEGDIRSHYSLIPNAKPLEDLTASELEALCNKTSIIRLIPNATKFDHQKNLVDIYESIQKFLISA